jgi:hypothetical protein
VLAYVWGYGDHLPADFIINIGLKRASLWFPCALFLVAKKAACEVTARSVPLPEDYRLSFWNHCQDWADEFLTFTNTWSNSSRVFEELNDTIQIGNWSHQCTAEHRVPRNNARVAQVARSMLAVELDMCEFLMRYCGEVMAR